jgi:hypothetical protein
VRLGNWCDVATIAVSRDKCLFRIPSQLIKERERKDYTIVPCNSSDCIRFLAFFLFKLFTLVVLIKLVLMVELMLI